MWPFTSKKNKNNIGSCKSRKNISCQTKYNQLVQNKLKEFNKDNSEIKSINDAIMNLRSKYKNNIFSDDFITVKYGEIINEDGKYIYECSLDFTKLFNILRYTDKTKNGEILTNSSKKIGDKYVINRDRGKLILGKVKDQIKGQLKPTSNKNNILKMDTVEWGKDEFSDQLIMKMDIERFYDEVLIKKKVLPKIRLSKKKMVHEFENPNFLKRSVIGKKECHEIANNIRNQKFN